MRPDTTDTLGAPNRRHHLLWTVSCTQEQTPAGADDRGRRQWRTQ